MMKDPVCGMAVDERRKVPTSTYRGKQYVFCGQECKEVFDQDPEKYIPAEKPEKVGKT